jgi:hypothetical protein
MGVNPETVLPHTPGFSGCVIEDILSQIEDISQVNLHFVWEIIRLGCDEILIPGVDTLYNRYCYPKRLDITYKIEMMMVV